LLPHLNVKLIPQLEKLKPGSRIVSHEFDMKGIKPDKMVTVTLKKDNSQHKVYLWTTPLKRTLDDPLTTRGLRLRRLMVDEPPVEENRESDY
jgi:hypothetical protein